MYPLRYHVRQYLHNHFVTLSQVAEESHVSPERVLTLVEHRCIPRHAYEWTEKVCIRNGVFGEHVLQEEATLFYPRASVLLVLRAEDFARTQGLHEVASAMKTWMKEHFQKRFQSLAEARVAFPHCFLKNQLDPQAFARQFEEVYRDWIDGVHGICVTDAASPATVATKEVLQTYLSLQTANGTRTEFTSEERERLTAAVEQYAQVLMPFSPHEYPRTSRKKWVDDLTTQLGG